MIKNYIYIDEFANKFFLSKSIKILKNKLIKNMHKIQILYVGYVFIVQLL